MADEEPVLETLTEDKPVKVSLWKRLPLSQKVSVLMFFLLLLVFPVTLLATFFQVNLYQKASEPITSPITPTSLPPTVIPTQAPGCTGCWSNLSLCTKSCGKVCIRIVSFSEIQTLCGKTTKNAKPVYYSCCTSFPRATLIPTYSPTPPKNLY